uniref:Methyltransferase family protein n=1 Tax=Solanum tuberosum TaxID=4113 RepID=M1AMV4_SOLTU
MIRNKAIWGKVGMTFMTDKMREVRLRWFGHGHVKRRCADTLVRRLVVTGFRRGSGDQKRNGGS